MTRRKKQLLVPQAAKAVEQFKGEVMAQEGFYSGLKEPDNVKYEVAEEIGIPLNEGYNGELQTKNAGKIGGAIGGKMVHEMIRLAQEELLKKR